MATVGAMRAMLSVNSTAFRAGMKGASGSLLTFSGVASTTTAAVYRLGGALTAVVGPFMGVMGAIRAMKVAETFEQEMNSSLAIVDNAGEGIRKRMEKVAFDVAYNTKFSMAEAAKAYYFLVSAGMDLEQSMKALPQVAAFAQAGMFDLATATEIAGDAQAAMGMKSKDPAKNLVQLTRVTDVLVKANKLAQGSAEQFGVALTNKAANAARIAGQSIEEVVSVLAAFAEKGVKGEEAGTAYARALNYLSIKAVENADAFHLLGVDVFDKVTGKTRTLVDVIADLEDGFAGMSDKMMTVQMGELGFTQKTVDLMKLLVGTSENIRVFRAELDAAGGTAQRVSAAQLAPLTAAWQKLKAVMTQWTVTDIAPMMAELGSGMSLLLDVTRDLTAATEEFNEAGDKFKPFSSELEGMEKVVGTLADAWAALGATFASVEAIVKSLGASIKSLSYLADIGTAATSPASLVSLIKNYASGKDAREGAQEAWADVGTAMDKIGATSTAMTEAKIAKELAAFRKQRSDKDATAMAKLGIPNLAGVFGLDLSMGGNQAGAGMGGNAPGDMTDPLDSQMSKASSIFDSTRTPLEKFNQTMTDLKSLFDAGAFTGKGGVDTYKRAIKAATDVWGKAAGADWAPNLEKQKASSIFDSTRTPLEKFNAKMEDLQSLFDVGAFSDMGGEETFRRAQEQARDALEKASGAGKAADVTQAPELARMGSQEAYDLMRQNRAGASVESAPVVTAVNRVTQEVARTADAAEKTADAVVDLTDFLNGGPELDV